MPETSDEIFYDKLDMAVKKVTERHFTEIKASKHQIQAWRGLFRRKDVFAILPTGSGN